MSDRENNKTWAWELYEQGVNYNQNLTPNQYNVVETNTEFFIGNQWLHLPMTPAQSQLPKPVFNILKRVASLFIASLTSTGVALRFEPLAYYDGSGMKDPDHDAAVFANAQVTSLLEKMKMEYRVRDALYDGAQTGDYCAHFWFDPDVQPFGGAFGGPRGEIQMELVDGINVMFGNPNDRRVQTQPYIIIVGRDTTEHLRWEAERYRQNKDVLGKGKAFKGGKEDMASEIVPDGEYNLFTGVGGKTEIHSDAGHGKALYVYLYSKVTEERDKKDPETGLTVYEDELDENGDPIPVTDKGEPLLDEMGMPTYKKKAVKELVTSVHVTKATRTAIIYEDVDTGLTNYPIAWGNWEKQKNQYHGRALVTGLIPNQIFINTMFATAMRHTQLLAFPKTVYNADLVAGWSNEIGEAIGVHGLQPGQGLSQTVAYNLQPAEMSNQIFALIDKVMQYTKECLGTTDTQMGNVKPDNTSALMVLQTNSEVPLENIRANLYEWIEDIGVILLDMMGTYYGERPVVVDKQFEEPMTGPDGAPLIDPMTGTMQTQSVVRKVVDRFDFSQLKKIYLNMSIDVGAATYFSEIAMTQTLDNLRQDGTLDVLQYLERLPDKLIPKKQELIDELRGRIAKGQQANAAAGAALPQPGSPLVAPAEGGELSDDKKVNALPTNGAATYDELPNIAKKTARWMGEQRAE